MIDEDLEPWSEDVRDAVSRFRQGHLVEEPPVFYAADLRHPVWGQTHAIAEDAGENSDAATSLIELEPDQAPPLGIVTTQDCDLDSEVQPWFAVAPVYQTEDPRLLEREYVHRLNPPDRDGDWLADLRIEMPVEKGALVGRKPIEAFPNEDGYLDFGRLLSRRRGRPALADVLHELVDRTMRAMRQESTALRNLCRRARTHVDRLMLAIPQGTRSQPEAVQLYVVTDGEADNDVREWFGEWWDRARLVAEREGLQLLPVEWLDAHSCDLRLIDHLVEIRNPMHT